MQSLKNRSFYVIFMENKREIKINVIQLKFGNRVLNQINFGVKHFFYIKRIKV